MIKEVIGDCTLYCGDMADIIYDINFDAIISDPPYGIGFEYNSYKDVKGNEYIEILNKLKGFKLGLLHYPEETMKYFVKVFGCPDEVMTWVYNSNISRQTRLWSFWGCDVDVKKSKQKAKNFDNKKVENMYVAGYDWREFNLVKNESKEKTEHPCQVPEKCMDWVLECLNEEIIFDPFMGSGTTGVSCINTNKKFIGIEIDRKYFDIACKRIEQTYDRPRLF